MIGPVPIGDPLFDALPADERSRISWRIMLMRQLDSAANKQRFLRDYNVPPEFGGSAKTCLNLHTAWSYGNGRFRAGDWRLLVDRRRSGKAWRSASERGRYAPEFVTAVRELFVENKRKIKPAIRKLYEWWYTGERLVNGRLQRLPVPAYGVATLGPSGERPALPPGWSETNLRRLCRLPQSQLAIAREGIAAARAHVPHVLTTRVGLRWLEQVMFDDVKLDWRVFDPSSGQVCDLWLLVAMDWASACALGFWMRPAIARDDGSQEHLRQSDMMQFCGWLLSRYGLPLDYCCTWKIENGTATLETAVAAALPGLFGPRLRVSFARMIGGKSPAGYTERAKGNSWAKAPLESYFNPLHNFLADVPGQTGRRYDVRPADLLARENETRQIARDARDAGLGDREFDQLQYPLLTVIEARPIICRAFAALNGRTDHDIEGFRDVVEPVYGEPGRFRARKESPFERAAASAAAHPTGRVPDLSLSIFYESTQRIVRVDSKGEIVMDVDGRTHVYRCPDGGPAIERGEKLIAAYFRQDPMFVYLTRPPPHCGYVATWVRRQRVDTRDRAAAEAELRRSLSALKADREAVAALASGERKSLDQMRRHNGALIAEAAAKRNAIDADALAAGQPQDDEAAPGTAASAIHLARRSVAASAEDTEQHDRDAKALGEAADEALLERFS